MRTVRAALLRLALLLLATLPLPASAQVLVGRVIAEGTSSPVIGADVRLLGGDGGQRGHAATDSAGWFRLTVPSAGRFRLRVGHIAFAGFTSEPLEIAHGETLDVEIRLAPDAIPLEPLAVTARSRSVGRLAGFNERVATDAFGRFVTREEIDRRPGALVTDFLRTTAGVRVVAAKRGGNPQGMDTNLILMRGQGNEPEPAGTSGAAGLCEPALWLDGVRIRQSADFPIDDLLRSDMLEGIEVYASAASAPAQYQGQVGCGVVLLWSRAVDSGSAWSWKRFALGLGLLGVVLFQATRSF